MSFVTYSPDNMSYENKFVIDNFGCSFIGRANINHMTFLIKNADEITC